MRFTTTVAETFLELAGASGLTVTVDGHEVVPTYDGRRLWLTGLGGTHEVVATARLPYVTDGDGMHRMVDPADGEIYLGAYLGMDIAQKVLCCFDQNDLKAPITLTVRADPAWTVLANGRTLASADGRWEHAGLPFGWHARRSLAAELDRDVAELRAVTEGCYDHCASIIEEPYPFDSFDQVFVPGLNWAPRRCRAA